MLLGEADLSAGSVHVRSRDMAFCDQNPWLWNVSIRDNIVGAQAVDEIYLQTVLWACAIEEDLEQLADGAETVVGSSGAALSGGQKARISLARAVYSRKLVLVLDDILSGLDARTERQLFERVFSRRGLLRRNGFTVLFATHAVEWLSHADSVVALASGKVAYHGPPDQTPRSILPTVPSRSSTQSTAMDQDLPKPKPKSARKVADGAENSPIRRRTFDRDVYLTYLKIFGWWKVCLYFLLVALTTAGKTMQTVWLKRGRLLAWLQLTPWVCTLEFLQGSPR